MKINNSNQIKSEDFDEDYNELIDQLAETLNPFMQEVVELAKHLKLYVPEARDSTFPSKKCLDSARLNLRHFNIAHCSTERFEYSGWGLEVETQGTLEGNVFSDQS